MKAVSILRERISLDDDSFVELVVWKLPDRRVGSSHDYKYRLALVCNGSCVMRYDNELGKGDHKHLGDIETEYVLKDLDQLRSDFMADVGKWRRK